MMQNNVYQHTLKEGNMKKMSKHIVLSFAVSSLLFSQVYALSQGSKFTHGSSGAIHTSGNTVTIIEKGKIILSNGVVVLI